MNQVHAPEELTVERQGDTWIVHGDRVRRQMTLTDLENPEAVRHLQEALRRLGIEDALRAAGARTGDTVAIGGVTFTLQFDA